jgi:hypothetical protein
MKEETLRKRLAGISQEELESCVKDMNKFSDLAWEIAFRIAEDDLNTPLFKNKTHVETYPDDEGGGFISVWPCMPDRFIMVRDRGTQVSLTYRKSMFVPPDPDELFGDSPYMDWGLFNSADDALRARADESLWDAKCGWGAGRRGDVGAF